MRQRGTSSGSCPVLLVLRIAFAETSVRSNRTDPACLGNSMAECHLGKMDVEGSIPSPGSGKAETVLPVSEPRTLDLNIQRAGSPHLISEQVTTGIKWWVD
jgi:hypothetical protein